MDEAKYQMQRQGWHKAPQWLVTPEEIAKMFPILKVDDVLGGLFNPSKLSYQFQGKTPPTHFYSYLICTFSNCLLFIYW